jgi:hypothetical protein
MIANYIPTSQILSLFGLTAIPSLARATMKIKALDHMGNDCTIMGLSELSLQYNPEKLPEPAYTIDYARMEALGLVKPTLHYTGAKYEPITITFPVIDTYIGPPHATLDSDGNIQYNDFSDLYEVREWIYSLGKPMVGWNKPPYVRFQLGPYMKTGVLTKIDSNIVSMYPDGTPSIMEFTLTLQTDFIMVSGTDASNDTTQSSRARPYGVTGIHIGVWHTT